MSTIATGHQTEGDDRFARRQRTWEGIPGAAALPGNGATALSERDLRRTVVGEHVSPGLRGTFWPDAIFQTTCVVIVLFFILLALTFFLPPTVGAPAEPLNQELYLPRPAWYFYFLFQILEWAKGPILVPIGTFFLPNIAMIALILLPFYDRNPARKIWKRPLGILFFFGSMLFILVTTITNVASTPQQPTKNDQNHAPTTAPAQSAIEGFIITS